MQTHQKEVLRYDDEGIELRVGKVEPVREDVRRIPCPGRPDDSWICQRPIELDEGDDGIRKGERK